MAKLVPLEVWRKRTFDTPRPSKSVCYKWARNGHIAGAKKIGGLWFIDPSKEAQLTGNPLVDQVLRDG